MRFSDLLYQVVLPLKAVEAKVGKNHLKQSDFKFLKFFGPHVLKITVSMPTINIWSDLSQKTHHFCKNGEKPKFHRFFTFFQKMAVNRQLDGF